eukprot:6873683-Lingulodinium_polyedra.AAC.1
MRISKDFSIDVSLQNNIKENEDDEPSMLKDTMKCLTKRKLGDAGASSSSGTPAGTPRRYCGPARKRGRQSSQQAASRTRAR